MTTWPDMRPYDGPPIGDRVVDGPGWTMCEGDALDVMAEMETGSVDAIVTSPPYADQRSYKPDEIGGRRGNHPSAAHHRARSRRQRSQAPDRWVEWIAPYTAECLRVLSPEGTMMLNLGVVLRDGVEHECGDRIQDQCKAQGFRLLHRMVWNKLNGQVPSSPGFLTVAHEYVLWMAKTDRPWRAHEQPAGSQASRDVRTPHAPSSKARMTGMYTGAGTHHKQSSRHQLHPDGARPTTVLTSSVGGDPNPDKHSARMNLNIARKLVAMTTPPGGTVLDPFAGNATTGIAARRINRRFLGVELMAHNFDGAVRRLQAEPEQLPGLEEQPVEFVQEGLL